MTDLRLVEPTKPIEMPEPIVWTRYDEALSEMLLDLSNLGDVDKLMSAFDRFHEGLSDNAFWYMLGMIWNRNASTAWDSDWLRHFGSKRPNRAVSLMKPDELTVMLELPPQGVYGYRPQTKTGGLHPFIFCADMPTALRHGRKFGSDQIGTFSIPTPSVVAFFERVRGPEVLVLDCSGVTLETVTPVELLT